LILTVHDVGLGQFITLEHPNGQVMCWDAGDSAEFDPAGYLLGRQHSKIDRLFITNFDHDHVSGLPDIRKRLTIRSIIRNKKADANKIEEIKLRGGPLTAALESAIEMHRTWNSTVTDQDLLQPPPGVEVYTFSNAPSAEIDDTNNLSLVTVLVCSGVKIVISGDLERKGWDALLAQSQISKYLGGTHLFVASHHGRENGYHEGVMTLASPNVVIFSDHEVMYSTQQSQALYRKHSIGLMYRGTERHLLTTRTDGSLVFQF
jgi:beta-lactamase superfamily II metal-dependent hydrolase